ncbi:MAG: EMC3/TMCO1 family protein [Candidatus Bathyarchaeia archaeon]
MIGSIWGPLPPQSPPVDIDPTTTVFILGVAIAVTLTMTVAQRLLIDVEKVRGWNRELQRFRKAVQEARAKGDSKALSRVSSRMMRIQSKVMRETMKVSAIFFIPLLLIFFYLSSIYGDLLVAKFPISFPLPGLITRLLGLRNVGGDVYFTFSGWYVFTLISIGTITYRLSGLRPEESEE